MHARYGLAMAAVLLSQSPGNADVKTRELEYRQGETVLQGFIAWDDAVRGKRPGVLVVHEWWGHNVHARHQARRLAEAGYIGFALDMFGKGMVATHPQDAQAFVNEVTKDPAVLAARFNAALEQLKRDPHVDTTRLAAIGYCFGGAVVLVLTGGADPFVPPEQVEAFKREMQAAGVRVEVISYPGAKHGFTNPDAGQYGMAQLAYDAEADRQSWAAMLKLFKEVFP